MKSFKLVNPLILGQLNTEYKADTGIDAISQFWNDLSTHITNNIPALYVTLKDENNNLCHYKISEKIKEGSKVTDYVITEVENTMSDKEIKNFINNVDENEKKLKKEIHNQNNQNNQYNQKGGVKKTNRSRHNKSSSSSSDDDEDDYYDFTKYRRLTQPITMWYYTPSIYRVPSLFVPTFNVPIVPYVKIWIPAIV